MEYEKPLFEEQIGMTFSTQIWEKFREKSGMKCCMQCSGCHGCK